jgi:cytochrome P450
MPERWLEPRSKLPRMAYAPFGYGHRFCSGARFATIELVLALAIMAQRWRLDLVDPKPPPITDIVLYQIKGELAVTASRRH